MDRTSLCGLDADEIFSLIRDAGFNMAHAVAVSNSIYKKKIKDVFQLPGVPRLLKAELSRVSYPGLFGPEASVNSADGSVKYFFRNPEGIGYETVYLPDGKRRTVCVSTQSGCRMGCPFCATGRFGFHGNLSAGHIVNQVLSLPETINITNVVFMGMGEPMDNLDNVLKACRIITSEWGLSLSPANVTVSTVGITPGIVTFLENSDCNLTVSLHSPFPAEREKFIPVERKYPVSRIIEIMKGFKITKRRRLSVAYIMIEGLNDSDQHLNELIRVLKDSGIRINLLPFHQVAGFNLETGFKPVSSLKPVSSSPERMLFFKHNLIMAGISASVRKSRGVDVNAACGLLASINPVSLRH